MSIKDLTLPDIVRELYADMRGELFTDDPGVNRVMKHLMLAHGKGVRPTFMALAARLVGGDWPDVRKAATVMETIHIASLLHDDVLDGSMLRRGIESVNSRYSDKVSVLSGDYVFVKAMMLSHKLGNAEVTTLVFQAVERMIRGEICDSLADGYITEERYFSIIADKTASLFAASGEIGILLSGGSSVERARGRKLGECVGMAFQIVDDALDFHGDTGEMGKPGLMDVLSGVMTLPLIHSLRSYGPSEISTMLSGGSMSVEKLSGLVRNNGGIEYALGHARAYMDRARLIAGRFENSSACDTLDEFFDVLLDRRF